MKSIIILGSARSDGNTRKLVEHVVGEEFQIEILDLNDFDIGYFDYEFANVEDDFIPLCEKILQYDNLIFATPVYWYAMSAQLKTFFDRITDLMKIRKDLGRKLNGKSMMSISCGSGPTIRESFAIPFSASAEYLQMDYLGHLHGYLVDDEVPPVLNKTIALFRNKLCGYERSIQN